MESNWAKAGQGCPHRGGGGQCLQRGVDMVHEEHRVGVRLNEPLIAAAAVVRPLPPAGAWLGCVCSSTTEQAWRRIGADGRLTSAVPCGYRCGAGCSGDLAAFAHTRQHCVCGTLTGCAQAQAAATRAVGGGWCSNPATVVSHRRHMQAGDAPDRLCVALQPLMSDAKRSSGNPAGPLLAVVADGERPAASGEPEILLRSGPAPVDRHRARWAARRGVCWPTQLALHQTGQARVLVGIGRPLGLAAVQDDDRGDALAPGRCASSEERLVAAISRDDEDSARSRSCSAAERNCELWRRLEPRARVTRAATAQQLQMVPVADKV